MDNELLISEKDKNLKKYIEQYTVEIKKEAEYKSKMLNGKMNGITNILFIRK